MAVLGLVYASVRREVTTTPRGRTENLKPFTSEQDREAARRNGRRGGIASGKARRERAEKRLKEIEKRLKPWETLLEKSTFGKLKYKHKRFIMEFALYGNAAKAARMAGYSWRHAKETGCRLMKRVDILLGLCCFMAYIEQRREPEYYPGVKTETLALRLKRG